MIEQIGLVFTVKPGVDRMSFMEGFQLGASLGLMDLPSGVFSHEPPFFKVTMECGEEYIFTTSKDFPTEDLSCHCGNPHHVVIKWKKSNSPTN